MKRHETIVNLDELDESQFHEWGSGQRFGGRMGEIAQAVGASKLGYNLTVVGAGKRAFPHHHHHAIEEMFFILEGSGEIRIGNERFPIRSGDVIACPTGGPDTAHQIINTMDEGELKYLAVSNVAYPDICQYPDSGKTLVSHRWNSGGEEDDVLRFILRKGEGEVDYWEDEE